MLLDKYFFVDMSGKKLAYGEISNDEKHRFEDGSFIRTSPVIREYSDEATGKKYIETKNSVYELGKANDDRP